MSVVMDVMRKDPSRFRTSADVADIAGLGLTHAHQALRQLGDYGLVAYEKRMSRSDLGPSRCFYWRLSGLGEVWPTYLPFYSGLYVLLREMARRPGATDRQLAVACGRERHALPLIDGAAP